MSKIVHLYFKGGSAVPLVLSEHTAKQVLDSVGKTGEREIITEDGLLFRYVCSEVMAVDCIDKKILEQRAKQQVIGQQRPYGAMQGNVSGYPHRGF